MTTDTGFPKTHPLFYHFIFGLFCALHSVGGAEVGQVAEQANHNLRRDHPQMRGSHVFVKTFL